MQWPLAWTAPNYLLRSFPYTLIAAWNDIPEQAIPEPHASRGMQAFKSRMLAERHAAQAAIVIIGQVQTPILPGLGVGDSIPWRSLTVLFSFSSPTTLFVERQYRRSVSCNVIS